MSERRTILDIVKSVLPNGTVEDDTGFNQVCEWPPDLVGITWSVTSQSNNSKLLLDARRRGRLLQRLDVGADIVRPNGGQHQATPVAPGKEADAGACSDCGVGGEEFDIAPPPLLCCYPSPACSVAGPPAQNRLPPVSRISTDRNGIPS